MPADYEKKPYQSNTDKHKENEQKAPPRDRPTDSDHTKVKKPKEKPS